jgi:hypothetical protein
MKIKSHSNRIFFFTIILLFGLLDYSKGYAQTSGSLLMLPDNFYAQMYNPSYMRADGIGAISLPGMAGLSFMNQGSFKISELITTTKGSPVIDFDNFYENIKPNNFIRHDFSLPIAFVSIPLKKGVFSFYYTENFSSVLKFRENVVEFLVNGNFAPGYRSFESDEMNFVAKAYREFAFGYAKKWNDKIDVGLRAKILFGSVHFNADRWNFGVETSPLGDVATLRSRGGGHLVLPYPVILNNNNSIYTIEAQSAIKKYFGAYKNPGIAIDAGITYYIDDKNTFTASLRDMGGIWNRHNSFEMTQNEEYDFVGFDLVSAVRYPEELGYTEPHFFVKTIKDSVSQVYQPKVNLNRFVGGLEPKAVLHYQYQHSEKLSIGVTNQSAFRLNNFQNILSASAMQTFSNLSVFESVNIHGVSDISVGGGLQFESHRFQFFLATDNIIAFYHPAKNRAFSIAAGICLLLKSKDETNVSKKGFKKGKGETSKELPFYKKIR